MYVINRYLSYCHNPVTANTLPNGDSRDFDFLILLPCDKCILRYSIF